MNVTTEIEKLSIVDDNKDQSEAIAAYTPYILPPPGVDGIGAMLKAAKQDPNWIIEGLLEEGDQLLVGGPPKSGKSLFAMQLALV